MGTKPGKQTGLAQKPTGVRTDPNPLARVLAAAEISAQTTVHGQGACTGLPCILAGTAPAPLRSANWPAVARRGGGRL